MLSDVPDFDYSKDISRCPNGKVYKYWTYLSATEALPDADVLIQKAKELYLKTKFLVNRCNKLRNDMIHDLKSIPKLRPEWEKYNKEHQVVSVRSTEACNTLRQKGIIIHEMVHGIVLFPFLIPDSEMPAVYLYRGGSGIIETWCSYAEINEDLDRIEGTDIPSRFVTGIVNSIPKTWKLI